MFCRGYIVCKNHIFFVLIDVVPCLDCADFLSIISGYVLAMVSLTNIVFGTNVFGFCVSLWPLLVLLLAYCKCFVHLCGYIVYRVFL